MKKNDKEDWIDKRKDLVHLENDIEKFFIRFIRFSKKHYEFWLGFFVCAFITILLSKL